jgi:hypothetical protein
MRTVGRVLVVGWLVAALVVMALDGRLPWFLGWTMPTSLVALVVGAVVRQQLAPSRYCRPSLPESYRAADDLSRPLAEVVAVAEHEAGGR